MAPLLRCPLLDVPTEVLRQGSNSLVYLSGWRTGLFYRPLDVISGDRFGESEIKNGALAHHFFAQLINVLSRENFT